MYYGTCISCRFRVIEHTDYHLISDLAAQALRSRLPELERGRDKGPAVTC